MRKGPDGGSWPMTSLTALKQFTRSWGHSGHAIRRAPPSRSPVPVLLEHRGVDPAPRRAGRRPEPRRVPSHVAGTVAGHELVHVEAERRRWPLRRGGAARFAARRGTGAVLAAAGAWVTRS